MGDRVTTVNTTGGPIECDAVVMATGRVYASHSTAPWLQDSDSTWQRLLDDNEAPDQGTGHPDDFSRT